MQQQPEPIERPVDTCTSPAKEPFSCRLEQLMRSGKTPAAEIDAAIVIYERLQTAEDICRSVLGTQRQQQSTLQVFEALCAEAHFTQGSALRE